MLHGIFADMTCLLCAEAKVQCGRLLQHYLSHLPFYWGEKNNSDFETCLAVRSCSRSSGSIRCQFSCGKNLLFSILPLQSARKITTASFSVVAAETENRTAFETGFHLDEEPAEVFKDSQGKSSLVDFQLPMLTKRANAGKASICANLQIAFSFSFVC